MIDLHLHSNCSDGLLTPEQLVIAAQKAGLRSIALSDHDTVDGVKTAINAGNLYGIEVIPSVELSVCFENHNDIHLLGYWIDIDAPILLEKLSELALARQLRNRSIVDKVNMQLQLEGNETIELSDVLELAGGVIGRPHIARILIRNGYATDMENAFVRYLIPCNIPKSYWPIESAIATIHQIGGIAILAHPTTITRALPELAELIKRLTLKGLDGIELYNQTSNEYETIFLQGVAKELNLLITAGSDFHGMREEEQIGKGRGGISFSSGLLPPLRGLVEKRRKSLVT